jgi:uncharacterized protein YjiS (DUF1127 family)
MSRNLDCLPLRPASRFSLPFPGLLGWIRRLVARDRIDLDTLSPHMLRDLGLGQHPVEDPLAAERRRHFF